MKTIISRVALVVVGIGLSLIFVELTIRLFPDLAPSTVRVNPPVRRKREFRDDVYEFRLSDGDLFYWLQGSLEPIQPDKDAILSHVRYTTDDQGFRNNSTGLEKYDIVVTGDSFTEAMNVALPWPQKLSEYLGLSVYNLGQTAFGPYEESKVLREYSAEKKPDWIILAYFEGNDLYDAAAYDQAHPLVSFRVGKYLLKNVLSAFKSSDSVSETISKEDSQSDVFEYRYPIQVTINGETVELAFLPPYISWLSVSKSEIEESKNYGLTSDAILKAKAISEEVGARFLLVYIPSKPHIYLPHVTDPAALNSIFLDVRQVGLDESGYLDSSEKMATPENVFRYMDDQTRTLAELAKENGIEFVDLTPHFKSAAANGESIYYSFDTHWNQAGHDLAAKIIADYIYEES